jgi:hypothetical protein
MITPINVNLSTPVAPASFSSKAASFLLTACKATAVAIATLALYASVLAVGITLLIGVQAIEMGTLPSNFLSSNVTAIASSMISALKSPVEVFKKIWRLENPFSSNAQPNVITITPNVTLTLAV